MLKALIRLTIFTTLSLHLTQYVIGGYQFDHISSMILFIISITILYFFIRPLLGLVGMPDEGPGFLFMTFVLTLITGYVLTLFIPQYSLRSTEISELIIFGFVLPSKNLDVLWSLVFSSLLLSVLMLFFNWMCSNKK